MIKEAPILTSGPEDLGGSGFTLVEIKSVKQKAEVLSFGERIALLRKKTGMPQRAFALSIGINHSTVSRVEKGNSVKSPLMSTVVALAEKLNPDYLESLLLISSLAGEKDREYINNLLGLSKSYPSKHYTNGLNTDISGASTPAEKAREYSERRKRTTRQVASMGGIDHTTVSRFIRGQKIDILSSSFIPLVKGLGLTRNQTVDLFYSFGAGAQEAEEKAS